MLGFGNGEIHHLDVRVTDRTSVYLFQPAFICDTEYLHIPFHSLHTFRDPAVEAIGSLDYDFTSHRLLVAGLSEYLSHRLLSLGLFLPQFDCLPSFTCWDQNPTTGAATVR